RPPHVDSYIATVNPAEIGKPLPECLKSRLRLRIRLRIADQHANAPHAPTLLRPRRQRHRRGRAAEEGDEVASLHSITSSAMVSSSGGTVRPSMRAVWWLMTSSNFVDCTTGRSAGLAPLRMRPA